MHGSHRRLERFQILPTQRTPPTFYFLEHLHLQPVHRRRYSELLTTPHDLAADVVNFAFPLAHDNVAEVAGAHLSIALRLAVRHAVERGVGGGVSVGRGVQEGRRIEMGKHFDADTACRRRSVRSARNSSEL